jgi:hypothetical protein
MHFAAAGEKVKDRCRVLLTCNMTGEIKMKPLLICKSKSQKCFKRVQNLPPDYASNTSSSMTASVLEDYMCSWARERKNYTSFRQLPSLSTPYLQYTELVLLSLGSMSLIQSLDPGKYKKSDVRWNFIGQYKTNVDSRCTSYDDCLE